MNYYSEIKIAVSIPYKNTAQRNRVLRKLNVVLGFFTEEDCRYIPRRKEFRGYLLSLIDILVNRDMSLTVEGIQWLNEMLEFYDVKVPFQEERV